MSNHFTKKPLWVVVRGAKGGSLAAYAVLQQRASYCPIASEHLTEVEVDWAGGKFTGELNKNLMKLESQWLNTTYVE